MERKTLVNQLAKLPNLCKEVNKYQQAWDRDELVALGILTAEEAQESEELRFLKGLIDDELRKVEEAMPYSEPEYPKTYQAILDRLTELNPLVNQVKAIRAALDNLRSSENLLLVNTGTRIRPGVVIALFNKATDLTGDEYRVLTEKKERLERQGSKVRKLRMAQGEARNLAIKEAKEKREGELKIQYAVQLKRKSELDRLIESRRQAKLQPILTQIEELLETTISPKT